MKAANTFTHPLCPDSFAIAVIDANNRLRVKYYKVTDEGFTETDDKRVRRVFNWPVNEWRARVAVFI